MQDRVFCAGFKGFMALSMGVLFFGMSTYRTGGKDKRDLCLYSFLVYQDFAQGYAPAVFVVLQSIFFWYVRDQWSK